MRPPRITKHFPLVLTFFIILSCSEDSEVISTLTYDEQTLSFSHCLQEDWGGHTGTHYNMDFTLIGEKAVFVEHDSYGQSYFTFSDSLDFYVLIELFSPGKEKFTTGVFRKKLREESFEELEGEYVYRRFWFGTNLEETFWAVDGDVKLETFKDGTIRINFDVLLNNDQRVAASYEGIPVFAEGYLSK